MTQQSTQLLPRGPAHVKSPGRSSAPLTPQDKMKDLRLHRERRLHAAPQALGWATTLARRAWEVSDSSKAQRTPEKCVT